MIINQFPSIVRGIQLFPSTYFVVSPAHVGCRLTGTEILRMAAFRVILDEDARRSKVEIPVPESHASRPTHLIPVKELQLLSWRFCCECRAIATFHVRIGNGTSRRLLGSSSVMQRLGTQGLLRSGRNGSPRIPPMRVTAITWERSARELGERHQVRKKGHA